MLTTHVRMCSGGNILVDERGIVKLADFGACKRLGEDSERTSRAHTTKGSPYFMAPEVLLKQKYGRKAVRISCIVQCRALYHQIRVC
jgi:serine/threonine protein kinase